MICTLKDIAKELNVTVNTVSRALKDKNDISEELKEKVQKKAKELGYVPNSSAQFLRTGKTHIIAIVYDHYSNPYYSIVTEAMQWTFKAQNYNVMIFTDTNEHAILTLETVQRILSTGADGIISFLDIEPKAYELIKSVGKYVLILGRNSIDKGIDCITTDDVEGGYLATKHLIDNGHRDILMFAALPTISCVRDRVAGYKKALEEAGLPYRPEYVRYMNNRDIYNGKLLVQQVEADKINYTAIFCFSDILAYEAITELESNLNKRVPDDVSVVGYDYIESHLFLPIGLTTVDADKNQLADVAAEIMLYKLENQNTRLFSKIHTPTLVEGGTVKRIG